MGYFFAILIIVGFAILLFSGDENKEIPESDYRKAAMYFDDSVDCLHNGQYSKALDLANSALKINPQMIQALNIKASAEQQLGKEKEAITSWLKAFRIDPNDEIIKQNLLGFLFTNVFNNSRQGQILFDSLSSRERQLIDKLVGN